MESLIKMQYAYWKRLESLSEVLAQLQATKFEAIALWGESSVSEIEILIDEAYQLHRAYYIYFKIKDQQKIGSPDSEEKRNMKNIMNSKQDIIYGGDEDDFSVKVNENVQKIENKFREFLD